MNIKLITKAMHTLSLLSEDDVAMVMKLRGLSEDERQMLMLVLEPNAKSAKKPTKKPAGKGGGGKSARASGMAAAISSSLESSRKAAVTANDGDSDVRCVKLIGGEKGLEPCEERADHNIHHLKTHPGYHEFVAPPATHAASGD